MPAAGHWVTLQEDGGIYLTLFSSPKIITAHTSPSPQGALDAPLGSCKHSPSVAQCVSAPRHCLPSRPLSAQAPEGWLLAAVPTPTQCPHPKRICTVVSLCCPQACPAPVRPPHPVPKLAGDSRYLSTSSDLMGRNLSSSSAFIPGSKAVLPGVLENSVVLPAQALDSSWGAEH